MAAGITGIAAVLSVVLMISNRPGIDALVAGHDLVGVVVASSFGAVGATVLRQHPAHALGRVFLTIALLEAIAGLGAAYAARQPAPPLAGLAGLIADRIWLPGAVLAVALVTPLFPDGRAASKRWRPLVWAGLVIAGLALAGVWLVDLPAGPYPPWDSPLELPPSAQSVLSLVATVLQLAATACGLLGGIALVVQMRRGTPAHRRRLGWFFVAFLVGVIGQSLDSMSPLIPLVAWALFPVGLGVAMLRYGLFDGDRLLSRTLVSIALAIAIAGVFGFAVGLGSNRLGGEGAPVPRQPRHRPGRRTAPDPA